MHRGDIVAVVDTAKSAIEIEVFEDGVVEQLLVEPGTTVPVGEPLALLRGDGGDGDAARRSPQRQTALANRHRRACRRRHRSCATWRTNAASTWPQ